METPEDIDFLVEHNLPSRAERRVARIAEARAEAIARCPDPAERRDRAYTELQREIDQGSPWIPGAVFIANPGLDVYLLDCISRWDLQDPGAKK